LPLQRLDHRAATRDELVRAHTDDHFGTIERTQGAHVVLDADTQTSPQSFEAAQWAAGCALTATEAVVSGATQGAFALVRPPGHHAEPTHAMGFCLFNNAAVAAFHARTALGLDRVAVVDFDVHHGNGTQSAFYDDPHVLYISSHQYPFYPGTGVPAEAGADGAVGATVNFPLRAGHGDIEYSAIYGAIVSRMLEQFAPQLILVSAGFDVMATDPLGGMRVSANGVRSIATALVATAQRVCEGRIVFLLEGGYDLDALQDGVTACLHAMADRSAGDQPLPDLVEADLGDVQRFLPTYRELYKL